MSANHTRKEGIQVVKLSEQPGRRYELDEGALESVLLRADVRHMPVVVVSVAGAYRGGKSFILDFFLRYLRAPRASQLSGEWLGREDELLEGFDWRGGGEANTKGIHIWPEPIISIIESTGEKVAVILMDTQGTFDSDSDMGDNSTIFALSTLLSSVQIYNLRANIGEDDLQHLQLFTEYGKLAYGASEGKAFQTLQFLVRDWMSAYEHPHGYNGGQALLNKRLQPKTNQKKQLLEVRQHIHSCFEQLRCFLMPHPGLAVGDERFKGRLCDISEQFRLSLLELVPSLFDPNNLTPKLINGDRVQAQCLLDYFKEYVNTFNSDDLPEATTIFQATANACLMSALREAREHYEASMDENIVEDQSVTADMIQDWHRRSIQVALEHFNNKKKLGSQEEISSQIEGLEKELEARLSLYLWQNDAKLRDTVALAKAAYDRRVSSVCEVSARLCLHERDLASLHMRATSDALEVFDKARRVPREHDQDRKKLIEDLQNQYRHLCSVNDQNNKNAIMHAREKYVTTMKDAASQAGVSTEVLNKQHEKALTSAVKHFETFRNVKTKEAEDPFKEQLEQDILGYFEDFEKLNLNSNMWAVQVAEYAYNNHVSMAWGPQSCCFHPEALEDLHENAKKRAVKQFLQDRPESFEDDFKDKLIEILASRYCELQKINEFNNERAVEQSFAEYTRRMDKHSQPALSTILIAPFIIKVFAMLPRHHETSKRKAVGMFNERRRGRSYDDDEHMDNLLSKMEKAFQDYKDPLQAIIRELGLQNLLPSN